MDRSICAECGRRPSLFICFCAQTELCSGCLSAHITRKPGVFHQTVPLDSGALVQEMKAQEGQKQDLEGRKEELRAELERVVSLQEKALENLEDVKRQWVDEIETATAQIAALVVERCEEVTSQLRASLSQLDLDPAPSLDSLVPHLDLSSLLSSLRPQAEPQCTLYKFFGGQNWVGVFTKRGESMTEIRHTEEKFLYNTCWAVDAQGEVYVTGGSLMGSSRKDVYSYSPASNQLSRQASLCTARRSHASLVLSSTLYVFGGLDNECKLQAAESLQLASSARWEALPKLTYARAYLGCAGYKGAIFLAGGCEEAAMEVYLPKTNTYICFMLPNVELNEACSLLALDNSILIFHGNSQAQVLEYHPETGSAELLGKTGQGSVWSGCSPVLSEGKVYMLRLDSVVEYGLDSRKCNFVGRFGRQRRSEGEQENLRHP